MDSDYKASQTAWDTFMKNTLRRERTETCAESTREGFAESAARDAGDYSEHGAWRVYPRMNVEATPGVDHQHANILDNPAINHLVENIAELDTRVGEQGALFAMMNDTVGDLMQNQDSFVGDIAEIHAEQREQAETNQLLWLEISRIYRDMDELESITSRHEWMIVVLAVALIFLTAVSLTSFMWLWKVV